MAALFQLMPYERDQLIEFIREVRGYLEDLEAGDSWYETATECLEIFGEYDDNKNTDHSNS